MLVSSGTRQPAGWKEGGSELCISDATDDGAEHHRGTKSEDKQSGDLSLCEASFFVQVIDVRALQPVRPHHQQIHQQILSLEAQKLRRRV